MPEPLNTAAAQSATSASDARDELRDQAWVVGQDVKDLGQIAKDAAREALEDGKRKVGEAYEHGRDQAHDLEQQVRDYVREHPWKSLLYASGAGLIAGVLWSRRQA